MTLKESLFWSFFGRKKDQKEGKITLPRNSPNTSIEVKTIGSDPRARTPFFHNYGAKKHQKRGVFDPFTLLAATFDPSKETKKGVFRVENRYFGVKNTPF